MSHPEFSGRLLPGYDFVEHDTTPQDLCGHGTHVAGIAAATGNNAEGIAGVNWNAQILPVRVLGADCTGDVADVVEGLVWAVDVMGADVINFSIGTGSPSRLLEYGTYYAYQRGAAVVAAAGNNEGGLLYPAKYPWVLSVGAVDANDQKASFSAYGSQLDLVAPGVSILSTTPYSSHFTFEKTENLTSKYGVLSGTSMAAPHVSGAAAILAGLSGYASPDQIYAALTGSAEDIGAVGFDENTGYGMLRVDQALEFDPNAIDPPAPPPSTVEYNMLSSTRCSNVGYNWLTPVNSFKQALPVFGNVGFARVDLPFTFNFGGRDFEQVTVTARGYLSFDDCPLNSRGNPACKTESENFIIPTATGGNTLPLDWFAAPFWDDLNNSAVKNAAIYQFTVGAAPHRMYVVEWDKMAVQANNTTTSLTFQAVLFEGTNQIAFSYQSMSGAGSTGSSATIGLEYNDGYQGMLYAYNRKGAVAGKQTIVFVPHPRGDTSGVPGCVDDSLIGPGGGSTTFDPFCLDVPAGAFSTDTRLHFSVFDSFSPLPASAQSLNHFADIAPDPMPDAPLDPQPQVCYHYTAADVLKAGGKPQNLVFMVYDHETRMWDKLPTVVDVAGQRILAPAPHFSTFGVFAPSSAVPEIPPVTGAPKRDNRLLALPVGLALLMGLWALWRRR